MKLQFSLLVGQGDKKWIMKDVCIGKPILEKNDLGAAHTNRFLEIAGEHFSISTELEDFTVAAIILHDIR